MKLSEFKNRRVLILGLGLHGGGVGSAEFFAREGSKVVVTDLKSKDELATSLKKLSRFSNIKYVLGRHRKADVAAANLIIKNPGVPDDSPLLAFARRRGIPVKSDIEIFFEFCPAPIIGVTGTKGKSTTAAFMAEMLRMGGKNRVWLAGNIRKSALGILPRIRKNDFVILELSSFQLDSLAHSKKSPHIAVITNIFADHLNRYRSFKHYALSKSGIFRFQGKQDLLFISSGDHLLKKLSRTAGSHRMLVDETSVLKPFKSEIGRKFMPHELTSAALAISVARHLGIPIYAVKRAIAHFTPLPGRFEKVRTVNGVVFVNDTTATNPTAAIAALGAVAKKYSGGVVIIAGGSDKKLPSGKLAKAITQYAKAAVFLPGRATNQIKLHIAALKGKKLKPRDAKTMREAVRAAYAMAEKGDTVLLSPGAASFGLFKHEFDRGEQFVREVRSLSGKPRRVS